MRIPSYMIPSYVTYSLIGSSDFGSEATSAAVSAAQSTYYESGKLKKDAKMYKYSQVSINLVDSITTSRTSL